MPAHCPLPPIAVCSNLQVLENSEGGTGGTLLAALNNCVTPVGRRRLRQWLCRPLYRIADIEARQASELMSALPPLAFGIPFGNPGYATPCSSLRPIAPG